MDSRETRPRTSVNRRIAGMNLWLTAFAPRSERSNTATLIPQTPNTYKLLRTYDWGTFSTNWVVANPTAEGRNAVWESRKQRSKPSFRHLFPGQQHISEACPRSVCSSTVAPAQQLLHRFELGCTNGPKHRELWVSWRHVPSERQGLWNRRELLCGTITQSS